MEQLGGEEEQNKDRRGLEWEDAGVDRGEVRREKVEDSIKILSTNTMFL